MAWSSVVAGVAVALFAAAPADAQQRIVVRYRTGASAAQRQAAAAGARNARSAGFLSRTELLTLPAGAEPRAVAARIAREPGVAWAEPEVRYRGAAVPNDPLFGEQWALRNAGQRVLDRSGTAGADISAPAAWDLETGRPDVTVAVVDSGVASDHADLAPNLWTNAGEVAGNGVDDDGNGFVDDVHGWDWVDGDNAPRDLMGHGTHVAGIAAGRGGDGSGTAGIAWGARIMPLRVLDSYDAGSSVDIAQAFAYAARMGARVVNASILGADAQVIGDVVREHPETLFVTAAGNSHTDLDASPTYPCSLPYDNVVCVGASDEDDQLASFSNYGPGTVDLAAPGVRVLAPQPALRTVFGDDFESAKGWTGGWATTDEQASSPTHGFADSPHADYADSTTRQSDSPTFDVTGLSGCRAELRLWLELAHSGDEWSLTGTDVDANEDEVGASVAWPARLAGEWVHGWLLDLRHHVRMRLRLASGASGHAAGATIDDLLVRCIDPAAAPGQSFDYFSGTSMAAPMVSGVAALLWSRNPGLSVAQVRAALLNGADRVPGVAGRVATGRLDARAALARVPAAAPPPPSGGGAPSTAPSSSSAPSTAAEHAAVTLSAPSLLARRTLALRLRATRRATGLRVTRLAARAPRNAGAVATCTGHGCPFRRRTLSREAPGSALGADLDRSLIRTRAALLRPGARVVVTVIRRGRRVRFTLRVGARGSRRVTRACAASAAAPFARCR